MVTAAMLLCLTGPTPGRAGDPAVMDESDAPTVTAIRDFVEHGPQGATMRLDAATDFGWDRVHGFAGSASRAVMTQALGDTFRPDADARRRLTSGSALLVFLDDGRVVRQLVIGPPVFLSALTGRGYTPDEAILTVHTKDPGPYSAVRFVD